MSNLVIVSGDYSSGSTLLFTLFRKTGEYYTLYEPLHERLLEYLIWPLEVDEHHFFVENYFSELRGFDKIPELFDPAWGNSGLYLPPTSQSDGLYRYLMYLLGTAFSRSSKVMLKENRLTFRLGWIRRNFPNAKIVHIYREKQSQWNSLLRRVQAHLGQEDVGQESVDFQGFAIAKWCEDLKSTFPTLDARHSQTGYERFSKLWDLSYAENRRYSDVSIDYWNLTHDFASTYARVRDCVGDTFDIEPLRQFVVPPETQKRLEKRRGGVKNARNRLLQRAGRKYSRAVLLANSLWKAKS